MKYRNTEYDHNEETNVNARVQPRALFNTLTVPDLMSVMHSLPQSPMWTLVDPL